MTMKRWTLFLCAYFCLCLLSACAPAAKTPEAEAEPPAAAAADPSGGSPAPAADAPSLDPDEEPTLTLFRIVDGAEDGNLLLAKLCRCAGADVYRLPVGGVPVTLDGEAADPSVLEDGMPVEVAYNGLTLETFPAQMGEVYSIAAWSRGQEENPGGTCYDLCGLYLQVLDDLWQRDPALNENISLAGLDLSQAPGELTESEQAALAWRFGETHGVEVLTGTFEELREQGYFTAEPLGEDAPEGAAFLHWEDGCFFSIRPNESHGEEPYSLPTLRFDAEKWRSSLGAYILYDCSAVWPMMGTWSGYQIGSEMIS